MPYDGIFAAAIVRELQTTIVGARIDKIFQPTPDTLLLHCRVPGDTYKVVLSAHPRQARVHLTRRRPANPLHAPVFCMTLRKHLDPGRITAVEQQGLDRIIKFHIEGFDDIGRPARRSLIAELTGRNSNIVLVDEDSGRIIDALKRVNARVNSYRALLPGETYIPPPVGNKVNPRGLSEAQLLASIETAAEHSAELTSESSREVLRATAAVLPDLFDGMSPFAARDVAARVEGPDEPAAAVARALHSFLQHVTNGRFTPTLRTNEAGEPVDVWAFVAKQWNRDHCKTYETANEAADVYYAHQLTGQALADKRRLLQRGITTAHKRLTRKAAALENDLRDAARADEYRVFGELLTANMHLVGRGAEAVVPNYYDGGAHVTIPLDPTVGPAANAQRYFKRYSKLKTAVTKVQEQLNETIADTTWLDQAAVHVQMASTPDQLDEIARELLHSDLLPRNVRSRLQDERPGRGRRRSQRPRSEAPEPPLEAVIGEGIRLLIGGNGRQNDRISLRLARPDDFWFHVKDIAGAHVLLPRAQTNLLPDEAPDPDLIAEAAAVAAYFSKARHSGNVAVDWTLAKHVRKPRGARPGMVIYDHHRTVYVTPEEDVIAAQLARARQ